MYTSFAGNLPFGDPNQDSETDENSSRNLNNSNNPNNPNNPNSPINEVLHSNGPLTQEGEIEFIKDSLRLEVVTTCVNFSDILEQVLIHNVPQVDTYIVVTSHEDKATQKLCRKFGTFCIPTDLFRKNGRNFNKGAAINAGFDYFQWYGWRLHLDCDIILPPDFHKILFNSNFLDPLCIYGCSRFNVMGMESLEKLRTAFHTKLQYHNGCFLSPHAREMVPHYVDKLRNYVPIGYFQLWNARCHKPYPYSLGTAAHDDVMFASLWPESHRRHLPTVFTYHLITEPTKVGQNWDGHRRTQKLQ